MENIIPSGTVFVIITVISVLCSACVFYLLRGRSKLLQVGLTDLSFLITILVGIICLLRK